MSDTPLTAHDINITSSTTGSFQWKSSQPQPSLDALLKYVESEATKAIDWYWAAKRWKARLSRWIRLWALICTATAGLLPVVFYLLRDYGSRFETLASTSGLWASLLVGLAGGLLGVDRAFGLSSGWVRYVLAGTEIRKRLEEFRMDWTALTAAAGPDPSVEQTAALIQKAKEFRLAVEGIVGKETQDWAMEFQSNFAQLERDVKAQLDSLKEQVEASQQARAAAGQLGSIEAMLENADKAKDFTFTVTLEGADGVVVKDDTVSGSKTWARVNVRPGQYQLTFTGMAADGQRVSATTVAFVKPSEVAKPAAALPIA